MPDIVPMEFRCEPVTMESPENVPQFVHPVSGNTRRFILGDRFHDSTNPHKSPLCRFHDINLCQQANMFKTSFQEMKNNQKNKKRLRSSCVQGFGVHYLYNYLMDFYDNEDIVAKQREKLARSVNAGKEIKRDQYLRFIVN